MGEFKGETMKFTEEELDYFRGIEWLHKMEEAGCLVDYIITETSEEIIRLEKRYEIWKKEQWPEEWKKEQMKDWGERWLKKPKASDEK
jgi:hypothetical protein